MNKHLSKWLLMLFISSTVIISCNKNKDKEIEASIVEKTTADANMNGLKANVKDGVVTLSGQCKDETCKNSCEQSVKSIAGVKQVVNNITVAPVTTAPAPVVISADDALRTSVDSVTRGYTGVTADISDGVVTLRGQVKRTDLQNLMQALNTLRPKKIENQLVINK